MHGSAHDFLLVLEGQVDGPAVVEPVGLGLGVVLERHLLDGPVQRLVRAQDEVLWLPQHEGLLVQDLGHRQVSLKSYKTITHSLSQQGSYSISLKPLFTY